MSQRHFFPHNVITLTSRKNNGFMGNSVWKCLVSYVNHSLIRKTKTKKRWYIFPLVQMWWLFPGEVVTRLVQEDDWVNTRHSWLSGWTWTHTITNTHPPSHSYTSSHFRSWEPDSAHTHSVYSVWFPIWMLPSHGTVNGFPFPRAGQCDRTYCRSCQQGRSYTRKNEKPDLDLVFLKDAFFKSPAKCHVFKELNTNCESGEALLFYDVWPVVVGNNLFIDILCLSFARKKTLH